MRSWADDWYRSYLNKGPQWETVQPPGSAEQNLASRSAASECWNLNLHPLDWCASRICPDWNCGDSNGLQLRVNFLRALLFPILCKNYYCTSCSSTIHLTHQLRFEAFDIRCYWLPSLYIYNFKRSTFLHNQTNRPLGPPETPCSMHPLLVPSRQLLAEEYAELWVKMVHHTVPTINN